jgi:tetratricopeptide (TPR) repeat protein
MQKKIELADTANIFNDFLQKNRKKIFSILGIMIFIFIAAVVVISINDNIRKKSIREVEELNERYQDLLFRLNDEAAAVEVASLLFDLDTFAKGKSGFAGGKALSIIASIYSSREEWVKAEDTWIKAANAASKTYLGPVSFFNAAVAAEEQEKWEQAIELYNRCLSLPVEFPSAPHAQFSIGRLYEQLNNNSAAIDAYRTVLINWPNISTWVNLSRSRILALEIK